MKKAKQSLQKPLPNSVLILGESNTAKTHYAAQLYGRLEKESGAIKLRESLSDLTPFRAALENLRNGLPAEHSESGFSAEAPLKLKGPAGEEIDVVWPDYAGEQVKDMIDHRTIKSDWKRRLLSSQAWLLFIRPALLRDPEDIFSRPMQELLKQPPKEDVRGPLKWSDSARLIELLQLLLFARGVSALSPATSPVLGIMLSCWDELPAPTGKPSEVLRSRAPLLSDFIESRWDEQSRFIFGVAPVGKAMDKDHCDDEIIDQGPEQHGWIVNPDGSRDSDLTLPLLELLHRC